jgi:penicillin amidase
MDVARRTASGTLAELLGPAALAQDVELRTLGLRRAAERSLTVVSLRALNVLQAYADGVNAWVDHNPLPPEYTALELTQFTPWTPVDSLAVLKLNAFELSFDLDIDPTTLFLDYQTALGPTNGSNLFYQDLWRSAPFDPAVTIPAPWPHPLVSRATASSDKASNSSTGYLLSQTVDLARQYLDKIRSIPLMQMTRSRLGRYGSNEWAISGAYVDIGAPLLANDPHLSLVAPSNFYPNRLTSSALGLDVAGNSYAGFPTVILGHNQDISWGLTNSIVDVTDTYQEKIVLDLLSPSGLATVYLGHREPVIPILEIFRQNNIGDGIPNNLTVVAPGTNLGGEISVPLVTLIVPRRNQGPLISYDLTTGVGLSVQWTGFSATHEIDSTLIWSGAKNLTDFEHGLVYATCPPLNYAYSDISGNIAYFSAGEIPIRQDLQADTVVGLPPWFVRNGTGGNEWLPIIHPQPGQSLPYEILPAAELPHVVNPSAGWFVNANNDPLGLTLGNNPLANLRAGGGIYYLYYTFDPGFRAQRITQMINQLITTKGHVAFPDMQAMQADVLLRDAQVFVPYIAQAYSDATALGANPTLAALAGAPGIAPAVSRLNAWDFTTPTGITGAYDARSKYGPLVTNLNSSAPQAAAAATLYSLWRSQFVANTVDYALADNGLGSSPAVDDGETLKALRYLLDNFSTTLGVGASGLNFFADVPGSVTAATDRRDYVILESLQNALGLLAGTSFVDAFSDSTDQSTYLWGKLHRIVFEHPLGPPFSIPPADGGTLFELSNSSLLPGFPTDGGYNTVDYATHPIRAASENAFMFDTGPNARFVSEPQSGAIYSESALPGGVSGVLGSPDYFNLLEGWLLNDAFPLP